MTMDEYIEREALKERFRKRIKWLEKDVHDQYSLGLFHGCEYDADLINEPPAADVALVRHGKWRYYRKQNIAVCTECSFERNLDANFGRAVSCPNCGAKMDG